MIILSIYHVFILHFAQLNIKQLNFVATLYGIPDFLKNMACHQI
ncbi:hypothetical protein BAT_1018 [Bacillus pumilus ATCC 7061]|nr:hypothetical protein BAT_1018 [Bacillus pumilus ATCC 7061]